MNDSFDGSSPKTINIPEGGSSISIQDVIDVIYPVGSIYISVNNVNPSTFLQGTTWEAFATGRTIVGIDSSDNDFNSVEKESGSKSVTLSTSQVPIKAHAHSILKNVTTDSDGSHTHSLSGTTRSDNSPIDIVDSVSGGGLYYMSYGQNITSSRGVCYPNSTVDLGGISSTGNPVKWIACHHTHEITASTSSSGSHTHSVSISGTTGNASSTLASAHSNVQPSIVVSMWKRVS